MKITLLKDLFLEKLNTSLKFTSSRLTSMNALQGVCLLGDEGVIHFYSTNLNYYYHTTLKMEEKHKFKIVIEAKKISEFLSLINSNKVDLEIKDKQIIIESGKTRAGFPLFESQEYPLPPETKGEEKQKIKTSFLEKNLSSLLFSASTDDTRPVLTGINFVSSENDLKLVSTDGFRLSLLTVKKEINLPSMIVPSGFFYEAIRLFSDDEIILNYSKEEKILSLNSREHNLYTRLIEGDFPPFERVIPSDKKTTLTVDKDDLLRSVKMTSIFARDFSNVVILNIGKDGASLIPKTGQEGGNITYFEAKIEGEDQRVAFNFKFLIDFLSNVSTKNVIIELLRSDAPAAFKADGVNNFLHIIMPVRIQE